MNSTHAFVAGHARQHGLVLPFAMIMLVVMMFASIALIRSVDTSTIISNNLAQHQKVVQSGDVGIRTAFEWLNDRVGSNELNNTSTSAGFYSTQHASDPNWDPGTQWPAGSVTVGPDAAGNTVTYVIHRLCTQPGVAYNGQVGGVQNKCVTYAASGSSLSGASYSSDAPEFTGITLVYYRVTARVTDARNTTSYIQSMVLVPVT